MIPTGFTLMTVDEHARRTTNFLILCSKDGNIIVNRFERAMTELDRPGGPSGLSQTAEKPSAEPDQAVAVLERLHRALLSLLEWLQQRSPHRRDHATGR